MEEFKILSQFLDELDAEVEGHAAVPLTGEQKSSLQALALGSASDDAKSELETLLKENSAAMDHFAGLLSGNTSSADAPE